MNNSKDDIIAEIMNSIQSMKKQLTTLYDSVDKFKYKRHLIIYSYLLGYFVSKKSLNFDKEKIENSVEIFNKSIVKKEDFSSLILNIALSLNYYNELEKSKKNKSNCCYSLLKTENSKIQTQNPKVILNNPGLNSYNSTQIGNSISKYNNINNNYVNTAPNNNINNQFFTSKDMQILNNISDLSYSGGVLENSNTVFGNTIYQSIVLDENNQNQKSQVINSINPNIKSPIINMQKCEICHENFNIYANSIYELQCKCIIHRKCFDQYIKNSIENKKLPILCPKCKIEIHPNVIYDSLYSNNLNDFVKKYEKFSMDLYVMNHKDEYFCCPTPLCNYVVCHDKNAIKFNCPMCKKSYCMLCKNIWHDKMNCEQYKIFLKQNNNLNKKVCGTKNLGLEKYITCPSCQAWIERKEGCNKIQCMCGLSFCFKCGNIITPNSKECPCILTK